jgi:hypothetical protein
MSFATAQTRIDAVSRAGNVLGILRTEHNFAVSLRDMLALYQGGADPTFNGAFNQVFDVPADRATIAAMINDLTALITSWEADAAKRVALNLPPLP